MELAVLYSIVHSLPSVLRRNQALENSSRSKEAMTAVACDHIIAQVRTLIVNRASSSELLVDLIPPLAKFSSGLIHIHGLAAELQPIQDGILGKIKTRKPLSPRKVCPVCLYCVVLTDAMYLC